MKIISEGDRPFSWAIPFELLADKWRISNQLEQKSIKPRERLRFPIQKRRGIPGTAQNHNSDTPLKP